MVLILKIHIIILIQLSIDTAKAQPRKTNNEPERLPEMIPQNEIAAIAQIV